MQPRIAKVLLHDGSTDLVLCRMEDDTYVVAEGPVVNGRWVAMVALLGTRAFSSAKSLFEARVQERRHKDFGSEAA